MTVVLSISGLISQRTVRAGRALYAAMSVTFPADADLGKLEPAAPRLAGRRGGGLDSTLMELSDSDCGDFLGNSSDKKRSFPPPDDAATSDVLVGGVSTTEDRDESCILSGVTGIVRLCQLRVLIAR